jgi:hypothetical protein
MANHMSIVPEITSRTLALAGGLVAASAAVLAETISTETTVGTSSFLLGGAGLIAAISAFTKDYWSDRQKQREHEVSLLRLKLRNRSSTALLELYNWAKAAQAAVPGLPAAPEFHQDDLGDAADKRDA